MGRRGFCDWTLSVSIVAMAILTTPNAFASEALTKKYHDAIESCAYRNVLQLDDKISSAEVVGRALFDQCKGEHFDLWQAFNQQERPNYVEGYSKAQAKWMTGLVLYVRVHPAEIEAAAKNNTQN